MEEHQVRHDSYITGATIETRTGKILDDNIALIITSSLRPLNPKKFQVLPS